jgi:hypothetical protein
MRDAAAYLLNANKLAPAPQTATANDLATAATKIATVDLANGDKDVNATTARSPATPKSPVSKLSCAAAIVPSELSVVATAAEKRTTASLLFKGATANMQGSGVAATASKKGTPVTMVIGHDIAKVLGFRACCLTRRGGLRWLISALAGSTWQARSTSKQARRAIGAIL